MACRCKSIALLLGCTATFAFEASSQGTWRVSVDSSGNEGDFISCDASISSDGRFVVFLSEASNLVPGDANNAADVFAHDRRTGVTQRVSVDSSGVEGDGDSRWCSISANGRLVAFQSISSNLVSGDTNGTSDIFVHDRDTGRTTRVSVDSSGVEANSSSGFPAISADGRYVTFSSSASNLVSGDTNERSDIFVHDRETGATTRVSLSSSGAEANLQSSDPSISGDGRFVVFESEATNLVVPDLGRHWDVFVHDRATGETTRVSVDSSGDQANEDSRYPSVSADGRYVTFESTADNLVAGDTNDVIDVFLHDRQIGATARVSVDSFGSQGAGESLAGSISADGRFVAFFTAGDDLVPGDSNGAPDTLLRDLQSGTTRMVSIDSTGGQGDAMSVYPAISADGRFVAFESDARNLTDGDTNRDRDIFVHGPYLTLEASPHAPAAGDTITFTTWTGLPSAPALLFLVEIDGLPVLDRIAFGMFDGAGYFTVSAVVPPGLAGSEMIFESFGVDPVGVIEGSNRKRVAFR